MWMCLNRPLVLETCQQMVCSTARFWIVGTAYKCVPIVEHIYWRMLGPLGAQYCGERQRLVDERPRWQTDVWFLWMHRITANVSSIITESSVTVELNKRSTYCEVLHHSIEQLSWLRSRWWENQIGHAFIAEIKPQRRYCFCMPRTEYPRWIDRSVLIRKSPGKCISQKMTVVWKSAFCGRWRWSATVYRQYVRNDERLRKYQSVLDQTCSYEIELGTALRWRNRSAE